MGVGEGDGWENGLCGFCNDVGNCCCGYWCGPCQMGNNAERLGDSYLLCCLVTACIPCIPIFILRGKTRERYGIDGGSCGDACAAVCCPCCASVQMANELDTKGA